MLLYLYIALWIQKTYQQSSSSYFRQVPATVLFGLPSSPQKQITVGTMDECGAVGADSTIVAIQLYKNGTCNGYNRVEGIVIASTSDAYNKQYALYVRIPGAYCNVCLSTAQAKRQAMELTYFNNPCPQYYGNTYIPDSSYCSHQSTAEGSSLYYGERYARYRVGVTANQTVYIMSRAQISNVLKYTCGYWDGFVLTYNGLYYCYGYMSLYIGSNNVNAIVRNSCIYYMLNSYPVTFIHDLIPGMLYIYTNGLPLTNMYLNNVTNTWLWWDNTTVDHKWLNWESGYPQGSGQMAMLNMIGLTLYNTNNNTVYGYLNCMSPAISS